MDAGAANAASCLTTRIGYAIGDAGALDGSYPSIDPRAPLYWLANFLCSKGERLQAGQAVITGLYAGSVDLPLEEDITIEYDSLGTLAAHFVQK